MGKTHHWLLVILFLNSEFCLSQQLGIPFVTGYTRDQYGLGTQNWDIIQDQQGYMYFANNEGLLEFDGASFNSYPQPNKTILRSLMYMDGSIYAGGQNEFGVYLRTKKEKWRYKSLKDMIPEPHQNFEDIWTIESKDDIIFFRASDKIFMIQDDRCTVLGQSTYQFLGKADTTLFIQDKTGSLYELQSGSIKEIEGSKYLHNTEVRDIISLQGTYIIATYKNGLFKYNGYSIEKWKNEGESHFVDQYINKLDELPNGDIVIGTGFNGIIVVDTAGVFKYKITKNDGLPNDRINSTFVDRHNNLWVGLENGLAMIQANSPFSRIYPSGDIEEAGYDVAITDDKLYFGTNNGLFLIDRENLASNEFKLVQNSNGQVYGIDIINEHIFLSHHEGGFIVKDDIATRFFDKSGVWSFKESALDSDLILSGTYNGISVFNKRSLEHLYQIPELNVSSRFIEHDKNNDYWMSHPYLGIYKITTPFSPSTRKIELLGEEYGIPSNLQNHIFTINNELLVCTKNGIFSWDENNNTYSPNKSWNDQLGIDVKIRRLFEGRNNDIWFISENDVGVIEIEEKGLDRKLTKRIFPKLKSLMNDGWEKIIPYDNENLIITSIHGFIHYNGQHNSSEKSGYDIVLNEMHVHKDSIIYPSTNSEELIFHPDQNSFLFNVGATEFVDNSALRFQYLLDGYDKEWTPLSPLRTKEYNHLPPGNYNLQIKAINIDGEYSSNFNLKIQIEIPWYSSYIAKGVYLLLFFSIVSLIIAANRKRYSALEEIIDTTVIRRKEDILHLETEKMQAELDHKNRELVSATIHLVQKNDAISDITTALSKIKKESPNKEIGSKLQKLINTLKTDDTLDQGWDQVMYHFNEVHKGFFDRLKKAYPTITPKDQKMGAYLKMNLTSKEISTLMNVSLRGVEASRYRLRRKLELSPDINLNDFLMKF